MGDAVISCVLFCYKQTEAILPAGGAAPRFAKAA